MLMSSLGACVPAARATVPMLCLLLLPLAWALPTQNGLNYGANWEPDRPAYDSTAPMYPVAYSESEQQQQRSAGSQLVLDLANATANGTINFVVTPGVYRLTEDSLVISATQDFVFYAAGVELICEIDGGSHFRLLGNINLTLTGAQDQPFILESDPFGFTQGVITASDNVSQTIDFQLMDGYFTPNGGGRIQVFDSTGTMLPHTQDPAQTVIDLGNDQYRLQMNAFTFDPTPPPRAALKDDPSYNIFMNGNYVALEQPGQGGFEVRNNTGIRFQDILMPCAALVWALPELGDDVYERFRGIRRPGTSRLIGGGWPLQTFFGGSFTMIDSEVSHNFDDITDINSPPSWGFMQNSSRTFYMADNGGDPIPTGQAITIYSYPDLQPMGTASVVSYANSTNASVSAAFQTMTQVVNIRQQGTLRLYTVDTDVNITDMAMIDFGYKPRNFTFVHSYFHDGLAGGIQPKGADFINITNCVVERVANGGIQVGFDPFWWEGNPSTNIVIQNNTVIDTPYVPGLTSPAINVYAGGDYLGAVSPIQQNITITGNLVIGGMGPGIGCTRCHGANISHNLIAQADGHAGGTGALSVDVISQNIFVSNNIFTNLDRAAWQLPISTGPISPFSAALLSNNSARDPGGHLSTTSWQFYLYSDPAVSLNGSDWVLDPATQWPNGHATASNAGSSISFNFTGSEVAVRAMRGVQQGQTNFTIDGIARSNRQLDLSDPYGQDTIVWRSAPLEYGEHYVTVTCSGQDGAWSQNSHQVNVAGFLVMADPHVVRQCEGYYFGDCLV